MLDAPEFIWQSVSHLAELSNELPFLVNINRGWGVFCYRAAVRFRGHQVVSVDSPHSGARTPRLAFLMSRCGYKHRKKATRWLFSWSLSFSVSTRLKNSTVSSSVSSRPSWWYGGESLMPRSVNVLIGPSWMLR